MLLLLLVAQPDFRTRDARPEFLDCASVGIYLAAGATAVPIVNAMVDINPGFLDWEWH